MKYKAVIWDFGGVITDSPFDAFNTLENSLNLPLNTIRKINSTNPDKNAWALLERGKINIETFIDAFRIEANSFGASSLDPLDVLKCLNGKIRPDMELAVKKISNKMKSACITNNIEGLDNWISDYKKLKIEKLMSNFDFVLESKKIGIRKPDKEIYQFAIDKLNVKANQTIFLDDLGINLKPAKNMGIKTIKVIDSKNAINELEKLVGFCLKY